MYKCSEKKVEIDVQAGGVSPRADIWFHTSELYGPSRNSLTGFGVVIGALKPRKLGMSCQKIGIKLIMGWTAIALSVRGLQAFSTA